MKERNQIIGTIILTSLCASALGETTNNVPVATEMSTNAEAIVQSIAEAEKLYEGNPEAYFRIISENAKNLWQVEIESDEEYQSLFSSFTNMITAQISVDDKNSDEMLLLQSNGVKGYLRNKRIRSDRRAWILTAEYIGEIRSKTPPPRPCSNSSTNIVMPSSIEKWRQERSMANYNLRLEKANKSLTSSLLIYMENLSNRGLGDDAYFQQLADLASLTEEERISSSGQDTRSAH